MARGCRFSLPVTAVATAAAYIYLSTLLVFIDQWFGLWTSPGVMNAVGFTAVTLMCLSNYAVAIFTDPGRVPSAFAPDIEDAGNPIHEIKRKRLGNRRREGSGTRKNGEEKLKGLFSDHTSSVEYKRSNETFLNVIKKGGDLRYCQKCSHYKPPRAHHCRVCRRCVLRMLLALELKDHHCIWMNNCVGHANYKVFFVFVVYAVIACIYSLVLMVGSLTVDSQEDEDQSDSSFRTIYVISGLLLVPLSIALSVLLGWHIYLVLQNKTTIEYYEGVRAMWLAEKRGDVYSNPYDLGAYENLIAVLGPNVLYWICPTSSHLGSGLRFRTAYDRTASIPTS
ncbi:hypothetical protein RJ639_007055, partial [Escallonia herrerae]